MYADGRSPKHRSSGAGLRVTDPSDLYRRETGRRVDRRNRDQDTQRAVVTACADSTDHQYQVCNWFCVGFIIRCRVGTLNLIPRLTILAGPGLVMGDMTRVLLRVRQKFGLGLEGLVSLKSLLVTDPCSSYQVFKF